MYVYYITIKIYVLICTNIFSHFYCLCITSVSHLYFTMDFTHTQIMSKLFKTKISMPSQFYLHSYWRTPKLFTRFNYDFKCENNGRIKNWGTFLGLQ
jgi:hypothetical protein